MVEAVVREFAMEQQEIRRSMASTNRMLAKNS